MTREIADPPHPTPNPDGPHTPGEPQKAQPVPAGRSDDAEAMEEEPYDSFFDDVNKMLSQSIEQPAPDPVLGPRSSEDAPRTQPRRDDPLARLIRGDKQSPHTSEVFKAVVAFRTGGSKSAPPSAEVLPSILTGDAPHREKAAAAQPDSPLLADLVVERPTIEQAATDDGDTSGEPGFPWFQVLVLSYASAVTLALTWIIWTGRWVRTADPTANSPTASSESPPPGKPRPSQLDTKELPPIPQGNVTTLGVPVRIGDLKLTPLSVALTRVELGGSIDPTKYRAEESESLVLRVQFTNLSKSQPFAPLELAYLRDQISPLDRCFITTSRGATIGAYPLALDSEWSIAGQVCPILSRGETVETLIVSEPGISDRLSAEMTWRFRVRTGPYGTDVIGVRFRDVDVERDPAVCSSALSRRFRKACFGFASRGS